MSLRDKIEGLEINYILGCTGRFVDLDDVLRIVAEHEQETKGGDPIVPKPSQRSSDARESVTAPPVGQAGGEPYRAMSSVNTGLRAVHQIWEDMAGDVVRVFGTADREARMIRPRGKTWAEVEQMARQQEPAEVPRWSGCHANRDGDCNWADCPQAHDGEPARSGRSCPLWTGEDES